MLTVSKALARPSLWRLQMITSVLTLKCLLSMLGGRGRGGVVTKENNPGKGAAWKPKQSR